MIECVPNFSEGRRPEFLSEVTHAIEGVRGALVLDASMDASHNRSVVTFAAPRDSVVEAAFAAIRVARDRIDLRTHRGVHPRIGAADVVPLIPLEDATMDDCVALAHILGERVGKELRLPVMLYANAATRPERKDLTVLRRGQFEGLAERRASDPLLAPDYGPSHVHPSAGAVAIGARDFLVAYNIYLGGAEHLPAVRVIARAVRASDGGLPGVKALALLVDDQAQLSLNLFDLHATPIHVAHAAVENAAAEHGIEVTWSEIVGLVPEFAARASAHVRLPLREPLSERILEHRLQAVRRES